MNTKEPTLDEQIADAIEYFELHAQIHGEADPMMAAKIASLQRLKAIDAVQVPEEPERIRSDYFLSEHRKVTDYIDTLRDLLRRESAEKWDVAMAANIADEKRLDAEHQLAAMLKLGENPSEEMIVAGIRDVSILSYEAARLFKAMFAKLADEAEVKK